jgi:hypothetical protein
MLLAKARNDEKNIILQGRSKEQTNVIKEF